MPDNKFDLEYTENAEDDLKNLAAEKGKKAAKKAVVKTLKLMNNNLRHPSLNTHKYDELEGPNGEDVFESYAQNKTPGAYRIFWHYGPGKNKITILEICPHP
jgi:hypothetical protein